MENNITNLEHLESSLPSDSIKISFSKADIRKNSISSILSSAATSWEQKKDKPYRWNLQKIHNNENIKNLDKETIYELLLDRKKFDSLLRSAVTEYKDKRNFQYNKIDGQDDKDIKTIMGTLHICKIQTSSDFWPHSVTLHKDDLPGYNALVHIKSPDGWETYWLLHSSSEYSHWWYVIFWSENDQLFALDIDKIRI